MPIPRKMTGNFVATEVDDEVLIVDLDGGLLFSLSGTGRVIWDLIDGKASEARIVQELADRYDAPLETLERDLADLLAELADAALVERG